MSSCQDGLFPTCDKCNRRPCRCKGVRKIKTQPTHKDHISELTNDLLESRKYISKLQSKLDVAVECLKVIAGTDSILSSVYAKEALEKIEGEGDA